MVGIGAAIEDDAGCENLCVVVALVQLECGLDRLICLSQQDLTLVVRGEGVSAQKAGLPHQVASIGGVELQRFVQRTERILPPWPALSHIGVRQQAVGVRHQRLEGHGRLEHHNGLVEFILVENHRRHSPVHARIFWEGLEPVLERTGRFAAGAHAGVHVRL